MTIKRKIWTILPVEHILLWYEKWARTIFYAALCLFILFFTALYQVQHQNK